MLVTTTRRTLPPAADLFANLRRLNTMMDEAFGLPAAGVENGGTIASAWVPACDVFEDKEALRIVLELPGVAAEEVKISLENQTLTIRGEKKQVAEEKAERWHRYERSYGFFERAFTLPSSVDAERIQANAANGVLTLTLPKVERARPREIPVHTS